MVHFGTSPGSLNMTLTGSTRGTSHSFTLVGLSTNTTYYYTVEAQGGETSSVMSFSTPQDVEPGTASGTVNAT